MQVLLKHGRQMDHGIRKQKYRAQKTICGLRGCIEPVQNTSRASTGVLWPTLVDTTVGLAYRAETSYWNDSRDEGFQLPG